MVAWLRHAVRSAGASLAGVAVVSAILTASVALPIGTSSDRSEQVIDTALVVADDDTRFPEPVPLGPDELAILAEAVDAANGGDDGDSQVAAGAGFDIATPTPTQRAVPTTSSTSPPSDDGRPAPTGAPADPTVTPAPSAEPTVDSEADPDAGLDDEPTPTAEPTAAPTAAPIPTFPPEPTPQPADPTPTPTPTVRPRSTVPPRTPTPAPTPEPTVEPSVDPDDVGVPTPTAVDPFAPQTVATDLYAYVFDAELVQNEAGTVRVKAGNQGDATATGVVMSISTRGGTILSITPRRADWTCSGAGAVWTCSGPQLEADGFSRTVLSVLPGTTDLTVSVTVSHEVVDLAPGNNSATARIRVAPEPDPDPRVLRPLEALRPTVSPEATPVPTPTPTPSAPGGPAPTVPPVQDGVTSLTPADTTGLDESVLPVGL